MSGKIEKAKKWIALSCVALCVLLLTSCSAGGKDHTSSADAIISSVKEKIQSHKSENEELFSTQTELLP